VKFLAAKGSLDPRLVRVPGVYIDAVVHDPKQTQSSEGEYNPAFCGHLRIPLESLKPFPLSERKIVARRAFMELKENMVINLGFGMPDGVAQVAAEEGVSDRFTITIEQGIYGGVPAGGAIFGVASNPAAIIDEGAQFDFYSGSGLDMTCLGLAQADRFGNVNVSKFGPVIAGSGGFIDISQPAKKVVFCGTFTAGGLKTEVADGRLRILQEGKHRKFIRDVEHITFSGNYALSTGQPVFYVTERAVFRLTKEGLTLIEYAPGIDVEKDILALMDFKPVVPPNLKEMDARLFRHELMGGAISS
jgi:propionate CoA-transferase